MTIETISQIASRIKRKYDEDDPERLCREMGIKLLRRCMGRNPGACKGFFIRKDRIRCITLNADLPASQQRIILLHEFGHAVLHGNTATECAFHDFELFDGVAQFEYEANIYAAEHDMSDEEVLEVLNEDNSFFGAARKLRVPSELLDFKFRVMKRQGYAIDPPLYADSAFMKDIDRSDRF